MPRQMICKIGAILFGLAVSITTFAQQRMTEPLKVKIAAGSNLLVDVDQQSQDDFLALDITSQLAAMESLGTEVKLFNSVIGLNYILGSRSENERYRFNTEFYDKTDYSGMHIKPSRALMENYKEVFERLKDIQYLLRVKVSSLNSSQGLQGVQLFLYQMKGAGPFGQLKNLSYFECRYTSFTINPGNERYRSVIRLYLHQLLYESNTRAKVRILRGNLILHDSLTMPSGMIRLEANVLAPDRSHDDFNFKWEVRCLECPNQMAYADAPAINFFAEQNHRYLARVTATDGRDTATASCLIVATQKPRLEVYLQKGDDFSRTKIRLYSYSKKFVADDGAALFNLFSGAGGSSKVDEEGSWVRLAGNIQVLSSLPLLDFTAKAARSDSVPEIPKAYFVNPQASGFAFVFRNDSSFYGPREPIYYQRYSLFGHADSLKNIPVPSTIHFVLKASDDNENHALYNFEVQFHKKSRISSYLNFSALVFRKELYSSIALAGVGAEYRIAQTISADGSFGTATTEGFSSPVRVYGKLNANLRVAKFYNILEADFVFSNIYRETYTFPEPGSSQPIRDGGYRLRSGFGGLLKFSPSDGRYFPFSLDVIYNYYPIGYELFNFYEFGLRASFYFAK